MKRLLGTAPLLLALTLFLGGCDGGDGGDGGDDEGIALVEDAEAQAVAAIDGVVHDIAAVLGLEFERGSRSFGICGESYAPRGVQMVNFLSFDATGTVDGEAGASAAEALEADSWKVERVGETRIKGTKGLLTIAVEIGPAAVGIDISNTECLETSDDVARETDDRPQVGIEWK